jgi:hypothetical protein
MGNWILTPDDLKKGDLADPGWHPSEIVDYSEADADTDGSTNCIFKFKILDGPAKGIQAQKLFNEKALGFGKNLWKTLEFPYEEGKGYSLSSDLFRQAIGSKLEIYIKRGKSNKGNEFNEVADFRPLRKAA